MEARLGEAGQGQGGDMNEIEEAVAVLEETLQGDLERCSITLRAGDGGRAAEHLEIAMAKLGGLVDLLRAASHGERD